MDTKSIKVGEKRIRDTRSTLKTNNNEIHVEMMHPKNLIKKINEISLKEIKKYLDENGKFKYGYMRNCPVCNNEKFKTKFLKNGFEIRKCLNCSLVYACPRPTKEFLGGYYTDSETYNYFQKCILHETARFRKKSILKPKLDIVNYYSKGNGKILDVGAASGHFLELANESGWECYGVEPNQNAVNYLNKNFKKIFNTFIEKLETKIKFDAVTMWELAEHVLDPLEIFKRANSLLVDGGVLVLSTPNSEGFDMVTLNELSDVYMPPSHINYFNPKSIRYALKKSNFKNVKILTPGIFDLDKIVSIIKEKNSTGILDNFFREIEENIEDYPSYKTFKDKFTKFLQDNKISGHMVAIGMK